MDKTDPLGKGQSSRRQRSLDVDMYAVECFKFKIKTNDIVLT